MKKNNGWLNSLLTLVFIITPALVGYYFFLPKEKILHELVWGIAIAFIVYVIILTTILIYFKLATYDLINFNIPIAIILAAIFVTTKLPIWSRTLIILFLVLLTFPINMLTTKLKHKARMKIIKKNRSKV